MHFLSHFFSFFKGLNRFLVTLEGAHSPGMRNPGYPQSGLLRPSPMSKRTRLGSKVTSRFSILNFGMNRDLVRVLRSSLLTLFQMMGYSVVS